MPAYLVTINGENFLVDFDGAVAKYRFITHRCVTAENLQDAEDAAVQMLREDVGLRSVVKNSTVDPPVMKVEGIREIDDVATDCSTGLIWYPMNPPKRWWQFWKR